MQRKESRVFHLLAGGQKESSPEAGRAGKETAHNSQTEDLIRGVLGIQFHSVGVYNETIVAAELGRMY